VPRRERGRQRSPVGASDFPPAVERAPAARGAPAARSGVCARAAAAARVDASPQPRLTASLLPTVAAVDEPPSAVLRAVAVRGEAGAQACSYAPSEGAIAWEVCRGEAGRA
jgi:ribosomal protein S12